MAYKNPQKTPDNVYIDIKVSNNGESNAVLMTYTQQKSEAIVDNPSEYYLSLVRWKVPGANFPILIMPIVEGQPDPNLSAYTVTLETAVDTVQRNLYYTERSFDTPPAQDPLNANPRQIVSSYYFIYEYQHVLDMVNQALYSAWFNLLGKPVGSEAPYMVYDVADGVFSLVAQLSQYGVDILATPIENPAIPPTYDADIKIFFNSKLQKLFNGLAVKYFDNTTLGRDAQILVADYKNNTWPLQNTLAFFPSPYVFIKQQYSSISSWSPVQQILFQTSLIPIQAEYTSVNRLTLGGTVTAPVTNSYKKILTDFEPLEDTTNKDVRQTLQYYPQGPYRLIDLTGTNPLQAVDLFVTWIDVFGNEYYATVPPYEEFTAKLLFVHRSLYKEHPGSNLR
jgi:hypothetical protein